MLQIPFRTKVSLPDTIKLDRRSRAYVTFILNDEDVVVFNYRAVQDHCHDSEEYALFLNAVRRCDNSRTAMLAHQYVDGYYIPFAEVTDGRWFRQCGVSGFAQDISMLKSRYNLTDSPVGLTQRVSSVDEIVAKYKSVLQNHDNVIALVNNGTTTYVLYNSPEIIATEYFEDDYDDFYSDRQAIASAAFT